MSRSDIEISERNIEISERIERFIKDLYSEIEIDRSLNFNKNKDNYRPSKEYSDFIKEFFEEMANNLEKNLDLEHVAYIINEILEKRKEVGIDTENESLNPIILLPIYRNYFEVLSQYPDEYPYSDAFDRHVDSILGFTKDENFILEVAASFITNYDEEGRNDAYREVEYYLNEKKINIDDDFKEWCHLPEPSTPSSVAQSPSGESPRQRARLNSYSEESDSSERDDNSSGRE